MSDTSISNTSVIANQAYLTIPDGATFESAVSPQQSTAEDYPPDNKIKLLAAAPWSSVARKSGKLSATSIAEHAADALSGAPSAEKQKTPCKPVTGSNESTPTRRSSRLAKPKLFYQEFCGTPPVNKPKKASNPAKHADDAELAITKFNDAEVDEPESPLAKKSTNHTLPRLFSKISKQKTEGNALPSGKWGDGITRMLRKQKKLPKFHTPSSQLDKKGSKQLVVSTSDDNHTHTTTATDQNYRETTATGKKEDALKACENNPTNMGTSSVRPADADLDEPWCCANRGCSTGMTYFHRDAPGTEGFGRKAISDYLGRNKKETKSIDPEVWHTYCRKCYQRLHYAAGGAQGKNKAGLFNWHISNLRSQMQRLKAWRPEATFKAQLLKSMLDRSNQYQAILRRHGGNKVTALAEYQTYPNLGFDNRKPNKKGELRSLKDEEAFPVEFTDIFIQQCCGPELDYDDIDAVLSHIERLFDADTIEQMPPVEFLINAPRLNERIIDPRDNYIRWVEECERTEAAQHVSNDDIGDDDIIIDEEQNDTSSEASTTIIRKNHRGPLNNASDDEIEAANGLMLLGGLNPGDAYFGHKKSCLNTISATVEDFENAKYNRSNLVVDKNQHSEANPAFCFPPDLRNVPYYKPPGRLSGMRVKRKTDEVFDDVTDGFYGSKTMQTKYLKRRGIKRKVDEIAYDISESIGEDLPSPKKMNMLNSMCRMADDVAGYLSDDKDDSSLTSKKLKDCPTQ
ncbi:hypothetical protein M433DRAFT_428435 [Acidomyces richmondensis BFW]|nr:MAG: hypothetical protein FE78DRAFT_514499 [Acidomyces sp. 'richmondensis']KYG42211.1 hypothetical protein M433DRAFT_428435 [Acidomyces richmondensis BFW]